MGTEEVEPVSFPVEPNRLISVGSGLVSGSLPAGNITTLPLELFATSSGKIPESPGGNWNPL